jgi:outer membrane protein assembly factor BamB
MTPRIVVTAIMLALTLSGCGVFEKKKVPLEGDRVSVFAGRGELEPDKDTQSLAVVLPAPTVNDSWPQSGGFANYAMQHLAIGASPQVIWTANIGKGSTSSRVLTTPPVIADGKVFTKDAESTVSAFEVDTGKVLWSVTLKPEKGRDGDEFGGGLAWYGGRLFVTTGFAEVFSLNPANGEEVWHSRVSAPVRGAPLVFGDRVFSTSIDNKLHAMAAVDGSDLWSFSGLSEVAGYVGGNSPAGSAEYLVAPFTSGELVCLRLDNGRTVWNESVVGANRGELRAFGNLADIRGRPVIDRGLVYAMGSAGQVSAFDLRTGQRKWDRSIGGSQTPWAAGEFVFVVTGSADVAALSRDSGKVKWATPLTQYMDEKRTKPIQWGGPVLAGDRLLVAGTTGELLAISPYNGEIMGKVDMHAPVRLAPVVSNGTIYVLTDNGELIVLR